MNCECFIRGDYDGLLFIHLSDEVEEKVDVDVHDFDPHVIAILTPWNSVS